MKIIYSIILLLFSLSVLNAQTITGITNPSDANTSYTSSGTYQGKTYWTSNTGGPYYVYFTQDAGPDAWAIDNNFNVVDNAFFYIFSSSDTPPSSGWTNGTGSGNPQLSGFVLPVELTSFDAVFNQGDIDLKWETATEINNVGFDVERKAKTTDNYSDWEKISFIEGSGTTNSPKSYSYTDTNIPDATVIAYRLKQIDNDGSFSYSKVDSIVISQVTGIDDDPLEYEFTLSQNYPNPFNPSTKIKYTVPSRTNISAQHVDLKVYDIIGNEVAALVNEPQSAGEYEITFNANGLPSGVYLYKLNIEGNIEARKMILLK